MCLDVRATTLDPVVVTATRWSTKVDQTLADVTVIGREDIERSGTRSLPELLAIQPGVQVTSYGGLLSSVFLRGMESRHTLLLVDGVRYGSATTGGPSWDNLPLDMIERIEIVRGPASGLYGSEAVGGVIQIFTRKGGAGFKSNGQLALGSNRDSQASGGFTFGHEAWDGAVQIQHRENKGISATNAHVPWGVYNPDRDGFRQDALSARLGLKLSPGWRADASMLHSTGMAQFDEGLGSDSRARLRSEILGFAVQGKMTSDWLSIVRVARSTDGFNVVANDGSYALGNTGTVQTQLTWENQVATAFGGVSLLAEHLRQEVTRPEKPYEVSARTINAVSVGLDGKRGSHRWQANLRQDENSQYGAQTNGTLGYGYDLSSAWRVNASAGTSFVAPSFNQLYYPSYGNPNLIPEEGRHGEVGLRWAPVQAREVKLVFFENRIRNFISAGPSPVNVPRTRAEGVSLSYQLRAETWALTTALEHVDARNRTAGVNFEKFLPRRASDSLKVSADWLTGAWRWGGDLQVYGRRFDDQANKVRLGGFATVDLRADWRVAPKWTVGGRVGNVFDKAYETNYGYNSLGRTLQVLLRYSDL